MAMAEGLLVGVYADDGETLGIGRVTAVDEARRTVVIDTPVVPARIARVVAGRVVWPGRR